MDMEMQMMGLMSSLSMDDLEMSCGPLWSFCGCLGASILLPMLCFPLMGARSSVQMLTASSLPMCPLLPTTSAAQVPASQGAQDLGSDLRQRRPLPLGPQETFSMLPQWQA